MIKSTDETCNAQALSSMSRVLTFFTSSAPSDDDLSFRFYVLPRQHSSKVLLQTLMKVERRGRGGGG
ncbi:hypothetical protein L195_g061360 [Trifolium pratense]|uniref:Uncharacterized protein n=1 Tax=Trifolium pratense TaxID=57577 RepID=A0A2K3K9C8_TRIPR|nr:hypothetical protein L195_g061360 [Trifolium pratense]